ncbi:hypothetical protein BVG79_02033 [Ketogulonicigenium robustum]|uniref:Uncharacterized protein n=1 Tax=Ketogulonicigenium robustum TaxID=92947 RepID=A0A1W6P1S6_9RHOB|nr:hypothetical protein [Ketogulonicigenium robustum]ARO15373.1 hypothetical protein BVG79_02033 [Ketogulonicigenium robustum]
MKISGIGQALVVAALIAAGGASAQQASGGNYSSYGGATLDWLSPLAISSYEWPFKRGPIAVVAPAAGELATYTLVPCQDLRTQQTTVCSGNQVGTVTTQGLTTIVSGLYGRTFYLGMGGHGIIDANGVQSVLAWNTRGAGAIN